MCAFALPGLGLIIAGFGIIGYQVVMWLKVGEWPSVSLYGFFGGSNITWVGARRLVDWFLGWPLWVDFLLLGALLAFSGAVLGAEVEADRKERKRRFGVR